MRRRQLPSYHLAIKFICYICYWRFLIKKQNESRGYESNDNCARREGAWGAGGGGGREVRGGKGGEREVRVGKAGEREVRGRKGGKRKVWGGKEGNSLLHRRGQMANTFIYENVKDREITISL